MEETDPPKLPGPSLRGAIVAAVALGLTVDFMLLTVVVPIVPEYLTDHGIPQAAIFALFSAKPVVQICASPLVGPLVDRRGPRAPLLGGLVVRATCSRLGLSHLFSSPLGSLLVSSRLVSSRLVSSRLVFSRLLSSSLLSSPLIASCLSSYRLACSWTCGGGSYRRVAPPPLARRAVTQIPPLLLALPPPSRSPPLEVLVLATLVFGWGCTLSASSSSSSAPLGGGGGGRSRWLELRRGSYDSYFYNCYGIYIYVMYVPCHCSGEGAQL